MWEIEEVVGDMILEQKKTTFIDGERSTPLKKIYI